MTDSVKLGFEMEGRIIKIDALLPSKVTDVRLTKSTKYTAILASIQEIGIIEPPVVYPMETRGSGDNPRYLLLDGHTRIEALKEIGETEVFCLISTDDETYTYNQKVNRLPPIQEHFMILKASERGVSDERIARALKMDVNNIRMKMDLLRGICDDAVALLKNTSISAMSLRMLRRVKPVRQVEISEMMNIVSNYETGYCRALVAASPKGMMSEYGKSKTKTTLNSDELARLQHEVEALQRDLQNYEDTYGTNFLNLVIVRGYLAKLLDNGRIVRFLSSNYPDMLNAFQQVVESTSLEG